MGSIITFSADAPLTEGLGEATLETVVPLSSVAINRALKFQDEIGNASGRKA